MVQKLAEVVSEQLRDNTFYLLVVDDDEINRMIINELLKKWDITSIFTASAEEAFQRIKEAPEKIDMVLMDVHLPGMSGIEAARYLRSQWLPVVPILALTADSMQDTRVNIMKAGMNDVLLKPLKPDTFHQMIGRYIQKRLNEKKIKTN